ncbi:esterase/lipase family protein [Shewanella woodyi]|uniref:esterase/lipase family protein n=1 Tax=Shewanella woodyi TaxID=60961 RepID=UPI00374A33A3
MKPGKYLLLIPFFLSHVADATTILDEYNLDKESNSSVNLFHNSTPENNKLITRTSNSNTWSVSITRSETVCTEWVPDGGSPRIHSRGGWCASWEEVEYTTKYGTANIYRSGDNILDKPVVVVQPYKFSLSDTNYSASDYYSDVNNGGLLSSLRSAGYDVILYRYEKQDSGVTYNAKGLTRLLEMLKDVNTVTSTSIVGLSMGGVVSRYALAKLENANDLSNYKVSTFISFDAPYRGINFPKTILDTSHSLLDKVDTTLCGLSPDCRQARRELESIISKMNTLTFKELVFTIGSSSHDQLKSQLQQVGHVDSIPTLALVNGSRNLTQGFPTQKQTTYFKLYRAWYNGGASTFESIQSQV